MNSYKNRFQEEEKVKTFISQKITLEDKFWPWVETVHER